MTDPTDETQPHDAADPTAPAQPADPGASARAAAGASADPGAPAGLPPGTPEPALRADPDRPADSGWREPAWFPPRDPAQPRDGRSSTVAIVVGLVMIAVGAWFFLDRTLGIALPRIQWSSVWPVILIVIGALILVRSFQRKA